MSRKIEDLCPVVASMCKTFLQVVKEKLGIDLIITSTLRTPAEQIAYYAQGRKALAAVNDLRARAGMKPITAGENKCVVTKNLNSIHEFGCAFDIVIAKAGATFWDVKVDINKDHIPDYREIGKIGEAVGFRWGGRFGILPQDFETKLGWDPVHFEYTGGLKLAQLQAGQRPHEKETMNV